MEGVGFVHLREGIRGILCPAGKMDRQGGRASSERTKRAQAEADRRCDLPAGGPGDLVREAGDRGGSVAGGRCRARSGERRAVGLGIRAAFTGCLV